jgi:hypothetical protein
MQLWHSFHSEWAIGYGEIWPFAIRDFAILALSVVDALSNEFDSLCDSTLEDGSKFEESYIPRYGPTCAALKGSLSNFKEKASRSRDAINAIIPNLYPDGNYYWEFKHARAMWEAVEKLPNWFALPALFDYESPYAVGAGADDRIGGYIPGLPDL